MYESDRSTALKGCTKQSTGHPSLLPGMVSVFMQCMSTDTNYLVIGICYGFQVMRIHESPSVPFTVLYTRFSNVFMYKLFVQSELHTVLKTTIQNHHP